MPVNHNGIKTIHKLFFFAGGVDSLIAIASNNIDIFLVTFEIETMSLKE
jgi:hypothetical protein